MKRDEPPSRKQNFANLYTSAPSWDYAAGYDTGKEYKWPTPRAWQVYWFLVEHGSEATVRDVAFGLGLSEPSVRCCLEDLGRKRLIHVVQISRPGARAFRTVYGASLHGLWWCEECDALFLPMPVREGRVLFCPYCGSRKIHEEPKDERTGYGIADAR